MRKIIVSALALLVLAGGWLVAGPVQAQVDDWSPVSSVGMHSNPAIKYFSATSAWLLDAPGTSSGPCFGTWGRSPTDPATAGGTNSCVDQDLPVGPTGFDADFLDNPHGEIFTDGVNFSNSYFLSSANYSLPPAGVNAATRITSVYGYATSYLPLDLSGKNQSDFKQHRVWKMTVFNNYLYIGTYSQKVSGSSFGAQIWRHDPYTAAELGNPATANNRWQKVVNNGFNSTNNEMVSSIFTFNGKIYAGVYNDASRARLLQSSDGVTWSLVPTQFGNIGDRVRDGVTYNGNLYIATGSGLYYTPDGINWINFTTELENNGATALAVAGGDLYVGGIGGIYKSSDGSTFSQSTNLFNNVTTLIADERNRLFAGTGQNPTSYQNSPRQARIWCLGCTTPLPETGDVIIKLPPKVVYEPFELLFDGSLYRFINGGFAHVSGPTLNITTDVVGPSPSLESYEITINDIVRGEAAYLPGREKLFVFNKLVAEFTAKAYSPPPATSIPLLFSPVYDFKMSFKRLASPSTITSLANDPGLPYDDLATLSDAQCGTGSSHLCFKPIVELRNFPNDVCPSVGSCRLNLQEVVALPQPGRIIVEGNVLGFTQVEGFRLSNDSWVAVGGSIQANVSGNNAVKLSDYLSANGKLAWNSVSGQITALKDQGLEKGTSLPQGSYDRFNLNAPSADPSVGGQSSFTTGPGGKIWARTGNLTLGATGPAVISGIGTVVVDGNVTFANDVDCQNGTKFGVIATGSITFDSPTVECGAYVSLNGNITFNSHVAATASARGIFVTSGDIVLPTVSQSGQYTMAYDTAFAEEPSALFRELLEIVFTTSS